MLSVEGGPGLRLGAGEVEVWSGTLRGQQVHLPNPGEEGGFLRGGGCWEVVGGGRPGCALATPRDPEVRQGSSAPTTFPPPSWSEPLSDPGIASAGTSRANAITAVNSMSL